VRAQALSSHSGFPSDTNLLVDACIARVRATARLDDDAVLPPLPRVAPRRDVVMFKKDRSAGNAAAASSAPLASSASLASTQRGPRRGAGARSRWAVAFCAVVASAFGTAAFLASPIGHAPPVLRATTTARSHASAAASAAARATAALFTR
jgi:hypothetical protein